MGYSIKRYPVYVGRYRMIKHEKDKSNPYAERTYVFCAKCIYPYTTCTQLVVLYPSHTEGYDQLRPASLVEVADHRERSLVGFFVP